MISYFSSLINSLSFYAPPGLILSFSSAFLVEGQYRSAYRHEFIGTLLMIICTFSAGKWIGVDSIPIAWLSHAIGVVAADYIGGGPHVNPAVSVSMWSLGKCNYTEMYVRIAAQMGGGLVAFPLYKYLSDTLGWNPLGGPEFDPTEDEDGTKAFFSEYFATVLLCFLIYTVNWELHFGKYHYWIKQPLTALGIRYLIEVFPTAGPAMNPMLATSWAVFASDEPTFPKEAEHYFVYWIGPFLAALTASFMYAVYEGGPLFGQKLPFGPIKKQEGAPTPSAPPSSPSSKKKKKQ
eukprot:CAMPEP_0185730994 /NCGR_PEP_ID=MMETSP1171-20130828/11512_1 /TAXON_ID=374046 /ORGANISM="Helicotheca tamensis, Strain CCMP826" /LENGTH=291 /DNA_ID=CAMNT_0028400149 /DNA_START=122 /DNA_END=997 /DNA_ORIENTATION=-